MLQWLKENQAAPRPTVFIKDKHEDLSWLHAQPAREALPGLHHLRNGCWMVLEGGGRALRAHCRGPGYVSEAASLDTLLVRTRPKACFLGHHHTGIDADVSGVPWIGLNKVVRPGNRVAICFGPQGRQWAVLGEYPERPATPP